MEYSLTEDDILKLEALNFYPNPNDKPMPGELATMDERSVCVELFADFRKLGRFLLRDRGVTIAFGIVKKNLAYKSVKMKKRG